MRSETRTKAVKEIVYIANDGTEFKTGTDCRAYENKIHKEKRALIDHKRIEKLDGWYPYIEFADSEDKEYYWYNIETEDELIMLGEIYDLIGNLKSITLPETICVEVDEDNECYWSVLSDMKKKLDDFFNIVGYEIVKKGD